MKLPIDDRHEWAQEHEEGMARLHEDAVKLQTEFPEHLGKAKGWPDKRTDACPYGKKFYGDWVDYENPSN